MEYAEKLFQQFNIDFRQEAELRNLNNHWRKINLKAPLKNFPETPREYFFVGESMVKRICEFEDGIRDSLD